MRCLLGARYAMRADVLRQVGNSSDASIPLDEAGTWQERQDPITFQMVRRWVPVTDDDPSTPEIEPWTIDCLARPIIGQGVSSSGAQEMFGKRYDLIEQVRLSFSPNVVITNRDRVTNIRTIKDDRVLWAEEEIDAVAGIYKSTVFNVDAVVPIMDAFGNLVERLAILRRADYGTD